MSISMEFMRHDAVHGTEGPDSGLPPLLPLQYHIASDVGICCRNRVQDIQKFIPGDFGRGCRAGLRQVILI